MKEGPLTQVREVETRSVSLPVERRSDTIVGYAAVFGGEADIGGSFREVIAPGAFAETLKTADVRAYFDHDRGRVLGRTKAGTLRLKEDAKGLAVEIDLPDTSDGRDVRALLERGDVDGMSFGFVVTHDEWDETADPPMRTIHKVMLREVSVVSEPAYGDTSVALRSLDAKRDMTRAERAEHNRLKAEARIAERKAAAEQKFRRIG
jgi:HK97 family phage prohead protease